MRKRKLFVVLAVLAAIRVAGGAAVPFHSSAGRSAT
jgi:hypothetical protein